MRGEAAGGVRGVHKSFDDSRKTDGAKGLCCKETDEQCVGKKQGTNNCPMNIGTKESWKTHSVSDVGRKTKQVLK